MESTLTRERLIDLLNCIQSMGLSGTAHASGLVFFRNIVRSLGLDPDQHEVDKIYHCCTLRTLVLNQMNPTYSKISSQNAVDTIWYKKDTLTKKQENHDS